MRAATVPTDVWHRGRRAGLGALAALAAVSLGVGVAVLSWPIVVAAVFGPVVVAISFSRPEIPAIAVVALTLLIPRDVLLGPGIAVGEGALKITDILIGLAVVGWLVRRGIDRAARTMPPLSISTGVTAILGIAVLTGLYAFGLQPPRDALNELRPLLAYLLIFPLVACVRTPVQRRQAMIAILGASLAASVWIIALYAAGEGSAATYADGAIRVTEVPFVAPMVGSIWSLVLATRLQSRARLLALLAAVVSLSALFFTLQRGAWLAFLVALGALAMALRPIDRKRLGAAMVGVALIAAVAIATVNAVSPSAVDNPFQSGLQRFQPIGQGGQDVSALHREAEFAAAADVIRERPLTGIGLGGTIQFYSPLFNEATGQVGIAVTTSYIHSSYTWMTLKTGLLGLLALLALMIAAVGHGIRTLRRARLRADIETGGLGSVMSLLAMVAVSATGPHLTGELSTPYVVRGRRSRRSPAASG